MDDPALLAATRFTAVAVLLTTAVCYGSFVAREYFKGRAQGAHMLLAVAVTLEMGGSGLQQAYWWLVEVAFVRDGCKASNLMHVGHNCPRASAIAAYDWITQPSYALWIAGALIVMSIWLSAINERLRDWRFLVPGMMAIPAILWCVGYYIASPAG
jgi:hypothetical protein